MLNKVATKGEGPCHVVVDKTGSMLIVTNYQTGSTAVMPVRGDGSLGAPTSFFQHETSRRVRTIPGRHSPIPLMFRRITAS